MAGAVDTQDPIAQAGALVPLVVKETKAGYKTTEFWLTIATVVLTQLQVFHLPGRYGDTIATASAVLAYVVSRGVAKAGIPAVGGQSAE